MEQLLYSIFLSFEHSLSLSKLSSLLVFDSLLINVTKDVMAYSKSSFQVGLKSYMVEKTANTVTG